MQASLTHTCHTDSDTYDHAPAHATPVVPQSGSTCVPHSGSTSTHSRTRARCHQYEQRVCAEAHGLMSPQHVNDSNLPPFPQQRHAGRIDAPIADAPSAIPGTEEKRTHGQWWPGATKGQSFQLTTSQATNPTCHMESTHQSEPPDFLTGRGQ
jgi:hypothetical protein